MEWMLQVVDELDDAVCVVKQRWLGFGCEVGGYLQAGMTVAAVGAAFAAGLGIAS